MINRSCRACQSHGASNDGMGSNGNENGNVSISRSCKDKLRRLQKIDFSMVETVLYLDAYPESREALDYYHKLHNERTQLLAQMKADGCPPVCNMDIDSHSGWSWVNSPWPWELDAN